MSDEDNEIGIVMLGQRMEAEALLNRANSLSAEVETEDEAADARAQALIARYRKPTGGAPKLEIVPNVPDSDVADLLERHGRTEAAATQMAARMEASGPEPTPLSAAASVFEWSSLVENYRATLEAEGVKTASLGLDAAMSEQEKEQFESEWNGLVCQLTTEEKAERFDALLASLRASLLHAIVGPFGLGAVFARMNNRIGDKVGGPVTTVEGMRHAAASDLPSSAYANSEKAEQIRQSARAHYESDFHRAKVEMSRSGPPTTDAYTGKPLAEARTHIDHIVPVREIDADPALNLYLSKREMSELANAPENLAATDGSLNQSKGARPMKDFIDSKRAEAYGVDRDAALAQDLQARDSLKRRKTAEGIKHFALRVPQAAIAEAAKMGVRESIGLLLAELLSALFDEAVDIYRNGLQRDDDSATVLANLETRLKRVVQRVTGQFANAAAAFKDGALAGAISSVITVAINAVFTTAKRGVRIIREGILSLLKAFKMLLFPPPGMSSARAAHEASKIIAAAVLIVVGVAATEPLEKAVMSIPLLIPIASPLVEVCVGIAVGLTSGLVVYMLDQLDLFGAMADESEGKLLQSLLHRVDSGLEQLEVQTAALLAELQNQEAEPSG